MHTPNFGLSWPVTLFRSNRSTQESVVARSAWTGPRRSPALFRNTASLRPRSDAGAGQTRCDELNPAAHRAFKGGLISSNDLGTENNRVSLLCSPRRARVTSSGKRSGGWSIGKTSPSSFRRTPAPALAASSPTACARRNHLEALPPRLHLGLHLIAQGVELPSCNLMFLDEPRLGRRQRLPVHVQRHKQCPLQLREQLRTRLQLRESTPGP